MLSFRNGETVNFCDGCFKAGRFGAAGCPQRSKADAEGNVLHFCLEAGERKASCVDAWSRHRAKRAVVPHLEADDRDLQR